MTLSSTQLFIFAVLIAFLVVITMTWLHPVTVNAPAPLSSDVPEWFAVKATSTTIADNGQTKHEVSAQRLTYFDQLQQTAFIKPKALVFNPALPAWQLIANEGVSYHESVLEEMREIDLMGNVIIWREAAKDLPRSEMQTEFLKFFPEKDYVETDTEVTFTYGKHEMSGVGMWADLDTQQVRLLNNVKGKYIHE